MAKIIFYSACNYGKFVDDSDDGSPSRFFEKLSDAKSFAESKLENWEDDSQSFDIYRHETNTFGGIRNIVVHSLNRQLFLTSLLVSRVSWDSSKGSYSSIVKKSITLKV